MSLEFTQCSSASDPSVFAIASEYQWNFHRRRIEAGSSPAFTNLIQKSGEHRRNTSPNHDDLGFQEIDNVSKPIGQQIQGFPDHFFGSQVSRSISQAVAIGATNLIFTMLAMSVIDRIGRKTLLLIGSVGTAACLGGVAAIFFTGRHQDFLVWLLVGYIAFFAFSQGAVIWVFLSEVFPNRVRAKGQSLGSFSHWFMNALISGVFPLLAASSGGYPFVFFAVMMGIQFFVVLFFYPETKGVSLEEMQRKLGIA